MNKYKGTQTEKNLEAKNINEIPHACLKMDSEVKKERKKYMGWLLSGIMFGGVIGVFMTCIVIVGGRGDQMMVSDE